MPRTALGLGLGLPFGRSASLRSGLDQFGRQFLLDAATGLVLPGFAYSRSGPALLLPQQDGSLASFAEDVLPRSWGVGGWGYEFHPGWTQSFLRTHDLADAIWGRTGLQAPVKNAVGPNGANDSWGFVETAAPATGTGGGQSMPVTAGVSYTIKAVVSNRTGNRFFGVVFTAAGFGGNLAANINPVDGTVTVNSGSVVASSKQLANGNWELSATATATATASVGVLFRLSTGQTTYFPNYTGDGVSGVNVHALNFTNTGYPVPLTVATTAPGVIGAATMTATPGALGISLGSEFGLGIEYQALNSAADKVVIGMSSGAFANSIYLIPRNFSNTQSCSMISGGTAQLEAMSVAAGAVGSVQKTALRVKANDSRAAFNAALAAQDTACALPIGLNSIRLAGAPWGGAANDFGGRITRAYVIPTRAPSDADLAAMTA